MTLIRRILSKLFHRRRMFHPGDAVYIAGSGSISSGSIKSVRGDTITLNDPLHKRTLHIHQ